MFSLTGPVMGMCFVASKWQNSSGIIEDANKKQHEGPWSGRVRRAVLYCEFQ